VGEPAIWTIGYEGASQGAVIDALRSARIELLADIRYLPLSRRPGFSKSGLAAALAEAGIGYRHFKQLGTPPEGRAAARRGDQAGMAKSYAGQLELPEAMAQMGELRALASDKRTALLCFEREPGHCHRSLLHTAALADFTRIDLTPALPGT
jgi:uncharacterized protein (DUF488 family)